MEAEGEGKFTRRQIYEYIKDGKYGQVENAETETEVVPCLHIQATRVAETKTIRTCSGNWAWLFHATSFLSHRTHGTTAAATIAYKRLASLLADKRKQDYSKTISWLRCSISFSLVKSAVMCLRGARSSFHQPVRQAHCEVPLDVAISEGHVPSQQTMNSLFSVWHSDFFFFSLLLLVCILFLWHSR